MQRQLELLDLSTSGNKIEEVASYSAEGLDRWKSLYITFDTNLESGQVNVKTYFGNGVNTSFLSSLGDVTGITIGDGFDGFIQDIRVYIPMLQTVGSQIVVPAEASFLPQCLCPSGFTISQDESLCEMAGQASQSRYECAMSPIDVV